MKKLILLFFICFFTSCTYKCMLYDNGKYDCADTKGNVSIWLEGEQYYEYEIGYDGNKALLEIDCEQIDGTMSTGECF